MFAVRAPSWCSLRRCPARRCTDRRCPPSAAWRRRAAREPSRTNCASRGLRAAVALLPQLHEDDVPGAHRHDDQDDQRALGHPVALLPEGFEPYGLSIVSLVTVGATGTGPARPEPRVQRPRPALRPAAIFGVSCAKVGAARRAGDGERHVRTAAWRRMKRTMLLSPGGR